jgi:hypothetical protein
MPIDRANGVGGLGDQVAIKKFKAPKGKSR